MSSCFLRFLTFGAYKVNNSVETNMFDFNNISGSAKFFSDYTEDDWDEFTGNMDMSLFDFNCIQRNGLFMVIMLCIPFIDWSLNIWNIHTLWSSPNFNGIAKLMAFNFLIFPMIRALYRRTKCIEEYLKAWLYRRIIINLFFHFLKVQNWDLNFLAIKIYQNFEIIFQHQYKLGFP